MTALLGYGAHGRDIEAIWQAVGAVNNHRGQLPLRVYDDDPAKKLPAISTASILDKAAYIGANEPQLRRSLNKLMPAPPLVDPTAHIDADLADGCVVSAGAILLHSVTAGEHTHINYGAKMTRTTLGAFVTISPGVTICGDVEIGDGTLIGAGATICDRVMIGARCRVGAGAVVLSGTEVRDDETWVGVPAQPMELGPPPRLDMSLPPWVAGNEAR